MKSRPAAVIFILVTVTLDILAMGLIIPVLPKLILDFLGVTAQIRSTSIALGLDDRSAFIRRRLSEKR